MREDIWITWWMWITGILLHHRAAVAGWRCCGCRCEGRCLRLLWGLFRFLLSWSSHEIRPDTPVLNGTQAWNTNGANDVFWPEWRVSSPGFCSGETGLRSEIHKRCQRKMDNMWASEQQQTAGTSSSSESVWSSPMRGTATSRSHCNAACAGAERCEPN